MHAARAWRIACLYAGSSVPFATPDPAHIHCAGAVDEETTCLARPRHNAVPKYPALLMQAYAVKGEPEKEWYGDISAVTFVLKELLTISPQLCDSKPCIAWECFSRLVTRRSLRSSL